jgi:hypothetical protein
MQPKRPAGLKLAQLPLAALEALLDSPDLQAASENSVIAAVTLWLEESRTGQELTKEQKQRLAFKLRLSRATPWYLTRIFLEEGHWLSDILSRKQTILLTAAAHNPAGWGDLHANSSQEDIDTSLFGRSSDSVGVSWWEEKRPASSIKDAQLRVAISPGELWERRCQSETRKHGQPRFSHTRFYNGLLWIMNVVLEPTEADSVTGGFKLGFYLWPNSRDNLEPKPIALTCQFDVVGIARQDTMRHKLVHAVHCGCGGWGLQLETIFTSLEDATAKLAPFIHADGTLHIKGTVKEVS